MGTVQEARMDLAIHAQLECYSMHTSQSSTVGTRIQYSVVREVAGWCMYVLESSQQVCIGPGGKTIPEMANTFYRGTSTTYIPRRHISGQYIMQYRVNGVSESSQLLQLKMSREQLVMRHGLPTIREDSGSIYAPGSSMAISEHVTTFLLRLMYSTMHTVASKQEICILQYYQLVPLCILQQYYAYYQLVVY